MQDAPVILMTGASGGIGAAAARRCADRGARIAAHYNRNESRATELVDGLSGEGHGIFQADLRQPDQVAELVTQVISTMGELNVLVNNAGVSERHDISRIDFDTWQKTWQYVVETNLTGPANLSFCAMQQMLKQGGGRIVNVSSRGAFRGEPLMPWYGASKAGLNAMGQSMAQALGPHNIHVFTVAPGFVETEMARAVLDGPGGDAIRAQSSMQRVAQPDEVANTISYLALDAPEWMTGCIIDINGASHLR